MRVAQDMMSKFHSKFFPWNDHIFGTLVLSPYLEPDDGGLRAAVDEAVQPEGVPLQLVDRPRARVHRRPPNHHGRAVPPAARVEGEGREVLAQRACSWRRNSLSRMNRLQNLPDAVTFTPVTVTCYSYSDIPLTVIVLAVPEGVTLSGSFCTTPRLRIERKV